MHIKRYIVIMLVSLICALVSVCSSALEITSANTLTLNGQVRVLYEAEQALSIDEVIRSQEKFVLYLDDNPNYGFRNGGVWLHARLSNQTDNANWATTVEFAQIDYVDFYLFINNQLVMQHSSGKLRDDDSFRVPSFLVQLPYGEEVNIYIRAESHSSSLVLPLQLKTQATLARDIQVDSLLWGLFYGGLLILVVYNAVAFFTHRELSLLAYVTYVLAVIFWQLVWGGHAYWLTHELPSWINDNTQLIFTFIGVSSGWFTLTFLETTKHARLAHPLILVMLLLQILMAVASILIPFPPGIENSAVYGIGLIAICTYVMAGVEALFHKYPPAKYFISAWGILALGAVIGILGLLGVVPSNRFTTYCFQVGVFFEACVFSFALLDKQRRQLQADIEQATNDLRNNIEYIEEQNVRLDIARKDALKASSVKSQFLANMSHEIRTPLNAIVGFSRELSLSKLPDTQSEQVKIINTAADTLLNIVNDVLDFSKIEAGKLHLSNQPYSITQLLEEVVTLMAKSAHNKRLDFIFTMTPLPEKIIGDLYRLKQVLNNLLSNALKFTSHGHISLAAGAKALPHGIVELTLEVRDTGIGISRDDQQKLFSAFSQVDDSLNRQYQGTGLGLVISREIVRLMGGTMDLVSQRNLGSLFRVTLRCNVLSYKQSLMPTSGWIGKRVVIFDPHPENRQATAYMLSKLGAKITSVETAIFLHTLDQQFDYLLCSLPISKLSKRLHYISVASKVPAKHRILLYAGQSPSLFDESLSKEFEQLLRLPLTPAKLNNIITPKTLAPVLTERPNIPELPSVRVLAVDDMEMNLKLIRTWLQNSAVQLSVCMNGQDAVSLCHQREFDLILMDIQMPGMDGITATHRIRQTALNMGTPIVAVTAHVFKEEKDRLLSSGLDDYLPKPVNFDDLCHVIKRWCSLSPAPELQTVDIDLAIQRSNHNVSLAKELFQDFKTHLPTAMASIQAAWTERDWPQLAHEVHRLHGASAYTGVPKLQSLAFELETKLKRNEQEGIEVIMVQLTDEADALMRCTFTYDDTSTLCD